MSVTHLHIVVEKTNAILLYLFGKKKITKLEIIFLRRIMISVILVFF
jgi:hypothetical protein